MNNNIEIFNNEKYGKVRTLVINNVPWFVGRDIAEILIYKEPHKAVASHVDEDDRMKYPIMDDLGRIQGTWLVNESGVYSLIISSKLQSAKQFKKWITREVLPSIRKNGGYIQGQEQLSDEELISRALLVAERKIAEREQKINELSNVNKLQEAEIKEMKPKVNYYDQILQNKSTMTITSIAKDYGMSAVAFNQLLHELDIQYKQSQQWFLYSRYQGQGYTHGKTAKFHHNDGTPGCKINTEWTQKGRLFIYNKLKEIGIVPLIERE